MPEGVNIEVAQQLNERAVEEEETRHLELTEIGEAIILAIVTIVTAWSGYQAARWDGHSAKYYGQASSLRAQSSKQATLGSQQRIYDITTFNSWLQAKAEGNTEVANLFVRRFTPGYKVAFDAWLALDPLHSSGAPPGPSFMPQYHNVALELSDKLDAQATATFEEGTKARETADDYVRDTLLLASVLFLIAIGQRFKVRNVRRALIGAAFLILVAACIALTTLPIA